MNLGGGEILVILMIALLVLGPSRLPGAGRQIGRALAEFRRMSSGVQEDLREAMNVEGVRETVSQVRDALDVPRAIRNEVASAISSVGTSSFGTVAVAPAGALTSDAPTTDAPFGDESIPAPDGAFAGDVTSGPIGVDVPAPALSIDDEFGSGR